MLITATQIKLKIWVDVHGIRLPFLTYVVRLTLTCLFKIFIYDLVKFLSNVNRTRGNLFSFCHEVLRWIMCKMWSWEKYENIYFEGMKQPTSSHTPPPAHIEWVICISPILPDFFSHIDIKGWATMFQMVLNHGYQRADTTIKAGNGSYVYIFEMSAELCRDVKIWAGFWLLLRENFFFWQSQ